MPQPNASPLQSFGLLVLRLGAAGLLFYGHGWPKITHFAERAAKFPDPLHLGSHPLSLGLVVFAEVFCTLFVALGLFTRVAVIPVIIFTMVAAFVQNAGAPWSDKDLALIYAVPFVALLSTGPGGFSLDAIMGPRRGGKA